MRCIAGLHLAATIFLLYFAVVILKLYCESFGCIGIGIACFAWSGAFLITLIVGTVARTELPPGTSRITISFSLCLQLLAGLALAATWMIKNLT